MIEKHRPSTPNSGMVLLGALFFVFGLVSWVNSILVPYFKVACDLQSEVQGYLAQFAFYIAYLVMTIPASELPQANTQVGSYLATPSTSLTSTARLSSLQGIHSIPPAATLSQQVFHWKKVIMLLT